MDGACGEWRTFVHDPTQGGWRMIGYVLDFPLENRVGVALGLLLELQTRGVSGLVGFQHIVTNAFHIAYLNTATEPPTVLWMF